MYQEFFKHTIVSDFIKQLVATTPIPTYNTVDKGDMLLKDCLYVYQSSVVRCIKTGVLGIDGRYVTISPYIFPNKYPKCSQTFTSIYDYYDTDTHIALGNLLRVYRDIYGVNLMPFYNCYSGLHASGISIRTGTVKLREKTGYKVIQVPIKFNKTYTIAIDSNSSLNLAPALIHKGKLVSIEQADQTLDLTSELCKFDGAVKEYTYSSFKLPFTYRLNNTSIFYQQYERDLYLLIEVKLSNNSSIVVLEGDYTSLDKKSILNKVAKNQINTELNYLNSQDSVTDEESRRLFKLEKQLNIISGINKYVFNGAYVESIADSDLNQFMLSDLSLLQFNNNISYPFADRLLEYLLLNVIDSHDDIAGNSKRIQEKLNIEDKPGVYKDVWSELLRKIVYDKYMSSDKTRKIDITGFIDKDAEKYIMRG